MTELRYPAGTLAGDYLRAGAGVGIGAGVLVYAPSWPALVIFGSVTAIFGSLGAHALRRNLTRVVLHEGGFWYRDWRTREMAWDALDGLKLRYYGTKRQEKGGEGFMQLKLSFAGSRVTFESNLQGFDYLAWRAAHAVRANALSVDPATAGNLLVLGIDIDEPSEAPPSTPQRGR